MSEKTEFTNSLTHARDELMRTFADLAVLIPGLSVSVLVSIQVSPGDIEATFFTNQDKKLALALMTQIIESGKHQQLIIPCRPSGSVPEAT